MTFLRRSTWILIAGLMAPPPLASAQLPTVSLSLNLRYHDPADPTEGGRWFLVAKTSAEAGNLGLASLDVYLANIDPTGIVFGNAGMNSFSYRSRGYVAVTAADIGAQPNAPDGGPFAGLVDGFVHLRYAQDNSPGAATPLKLSVGQGYGSPGNNALDPLRGITDASKIWNDAALIASGTFLGGGNQSNHFNRPTFVVPSSVAPFAAVLTSTTPGSPLAAANLTTVVRGDSVRDLGLNSPPGSGLIRGDANRDFWIDSDEDFKGPLLYWQTTGKTWDSGDYTDGLPGHIEGNVGGDDLNFILANWYNRSEPPTGTAPSPGTAVPEPAASLIAAVLLAAGFATVVRRRVSYAAGGQQ